MAHTKKATKRVFNRSPCNQTTKVELPGSEFQVSMARLAVSAVMIEMDSILFLNPLFWKLAPDFPRHCLLFAVHIDDKEFAFRANKRSHLPVKKFR
jgi:hypothetical protein